MKSRLLTTVIAITCINASFWSFFVFLNIYSGLLVIALLLPSTPSPLWRIFLPPKPIASPPLLALNKLNSLGF
jgi:hypothetical protein